MFIGGIMSALTAATSATLVATQKTKEYERGRHAAQLAEPFDKTKSAEWQTGYKAEIHNPSGGLKPQ